MDYNILSNLQYCGEIVSEFRNLLLYSHIPSAVAVLSLGLFVYFKNSKVLLSRIIAIISILFAFWAFFDLVIWLGYDQSSLVMFAWMPIEIFSILLFITSFYFTYTFLFRKDLPFFLKILIFAPLLPVIIAAPTAVNLVHFDLQECIAIESTLYSTYTFYVKIFFALATALTILIAFFKAQEKIERRRILLLALGILVFLYSFLISGYVSELTVNYRLEMYGLFGMVIFVGVLSYLIVRFAEFHVKLISTQALVITLIGLIGSQFSFIQNRVNFILTGITLLLSCIFGFYLVRSVKKEIKLREKIEVQEKELEIANDQQTKLIHFITHQVKGFFTKSRNVFASVLEGDYGPIPAESKPILEEGFKSDTKAVETVQEILNAANIRKGTIAYAMRSVDFKNILQREIGKYKDVITNKGLTLEQDLKDGNYTIEGDESQLEHVVRNLIDNTLKYTPQGKITVRLSRTDDKVKFIVEDTGVGITPEDMKRLFTEGGRGKDSVKVNVESTGYGLYIVKNIVTAHKGTIKAESEGHGKGSKFIVELPVTKQ